jgi:glutathione S-transferase
MTDTQPTAVELQELAPLARVISRTLQATPVRLGDRVSAADLVAALTVAAAAYMGRQVGEVPQQLQQLRAERAEAAQLSHQYRNERDRAHVQLAALRALAADWRTHRGILGRILADQLDEVLDDAADGPSTSH